MPRSLVAFRLNAGIVCDGEGEKEATGRGKGVVSQKFARTTEKFEVTAVAGCALSKLHVRDVCNALGSGTLPVGDTNILVASTSETCACSGAFVALDTN